MRKLPKIGLITSFGLLLASVSCSKTDVSPYPLNFECKTAETTLQVYANQDATVKKIRRFKPEIDLFVLLVDGTTTDKNIYLVPSLSLDDTFKVDNLKVSFSGEKKNCLLYDRSSMQPNAYYATDTIFIVGNKTILSNLKKQ